MENKWKKSWETFIKISKRMLKGLRITYGVAWNLALLFIILLVVGGVFAGGVGAGYFASLVKDEKVLPQEQMVKDINQYEETSFLYFADEIPLGKLRTDIDREEVKIDQISDYLKKAVIATEDEYFYEHKGVVPKALFRAVFQEFTNSSVQSGGSTLTQQLIKNQILTNEVSFDRKAKEVLLALRIEKFIDKDDILEAYLNVSTFGRNSSGQNIGGVQTAAKGIFGVDAIDLSLPQAAFIAGLPQSPFGYTPFTNKGEIKSPEGLEPGLNRMKTVLYRMHKEGYITDKEYKDALEYDVVADFIPKQERPYEEYPALTYELEERAREVLIGILAEKDGYKKEDLYKDNKHTDLYNKYYTLADRDLRQNGYHIHSTINKKIYDVMQKTKDEYNNYGITHKRTVENEETGEMEEIDDPVQIGAYLRENKTGKVLGFVAGRDYDLNPLNHATNAYRQNGSSMKPLLAYAPAFELGTSAPGAVVADLPYVVGGWTAKNYSAGRYYGLVTAREAIAKSYNAAAVGTFLQTLNQNPGQYMQKMGFKKITPEEYTYPSSPLGGITTGVTVEENTNAYSTFANNGKFIEGYMIEKITDQEGNIVYEHKPDPVEVFSPQTAYLMIDVLRDVIKYGTAGSLKGMLNVPGDWAGKTGTTNDFNDALFVGFNQNVTMGTWIGYKEKRSLYIPNNNYSHRNLRIWANLMNAANEVAPEIISASGRFEMPGGIVNRSFCAVSGMAPSEACSKAGLIQTDIFNAKFVPSKADDSLGSGRYVTANGKSYLAFSSTPAEFSEHGALIDPAFLKKITMGYVTDFSQAIPINNPRWKNIHIGDAKLEDNGKAPAAVKTTVSGDQMKWSASSSKDVIGYRVFSSDGKVVASIPSGKELSYKIGGGSYYVVAVNVAGRESKPSNLIENEDEKEKREKEEEEEEQKKVEQEQKEKEKEKEKEQQKAEEQKKIEEQKKKEEEQKKKEEERKKKEEEEKKKEQEKKDKEKEKQQEEENSGNGENP